MSIDKIGNTFFQNVCTLPNGDHNCESTLHVT